MLPGRKQKGELEPNRRKNNSGHSKKRNFTDYLAAHYSRSPRSMRLFRSLAAVISPGAFERNIPVFGNTTH